MGSVAERGVNRQADIVGSARQEAQRALAAGEGMEPEALPPAGVATAAGIDTKGARA